MNRIFSCLNALLHHWLLVALCTLPLISSPARAAHDAAAPALVSYTTQTGDSVERVLKNTMPDSPLSAQVLLKALADANPQVVTGKPGQKFKKGSVIQLPDHALLVRSTLDSFAPPGSESSYRSGYSASDPASRRHWIRYP